MLEVPEQCEVNCGVGSGAGWGGVTLCETVIDCENPLFECNTNSCLCEQPDR